MSKDEGMRIRREVLGDEHVDRAIANTTDFTHDFQDLITRYAWGEVWARPGLDRKTRSAITLTALTALNHHHELAMHVRAALRNGMTPDENRLELDLLQAIQQRYRLARIFHLDHGVQIGAGVGSALHGFGLINT